MSFAWKLAEPVDAKVGAKLVKALEKAASVERAELDPSLDRLSITVALHGLLESAVPAGGVSAGSGAAPRAEFCPNALLELLEREGIAVETGDR